MRTPYPELQTDVTALLAAFADWNAGVERARREYAIHPFSYCHHRGRCPRATQLRVARGLAK